MVVHVQPLETSLRSHLAAHPPPPPLSIYGGLEWLRLGLGLGFAKLFLAVPLLLPPLEFSLPPELLCLR